MRNSITLAAAVAAASLLAGCASLPPGLLPPGLTSPAQYSPTTYAPQAMQQAQQVQVGTIIAITPVTVRASGTASTIGTGLGAAVGGLLGHSIGQGNGRTLATVAGAVVGGIGGGIATQHLYAQSALQITVQISGCTGGYGCTVAITQSAAQSQPLRVGERVEIIQGNGWGGGAARVLPLR